MKISAFLVAKMTGCSAFNCTNRSEQNYKLKIFPKDPERRKIWASKVKRANWEPTRGSYLCEVRIFKLILLLIIILL